MTTLAKSTADLIVEHVAYARRLLVGRVGTLNRPSSKYHGRRGIIDDVMADTVHGLLVLFYVYRKDRDDILNGAGETRQYRTLREVNLTGEVDARRAYDQGSN